MIGRRSGAIVLGIAFAIVLGVAASFFGSPWANGLTFGSVSPILVGAATGFAFGYAAAARLKAGWIVWLLTLPGVALLVWSFAQRCEATTPGDDCGILILLVYAWIPPWVIGLVLLGVATVLLRRSARPR